MKHKIKHNLRSTIATIALFSILASFSSSSLNAARTATEETAYQRTVNDAADKIAEGLKTVTPYLHGIGRSLQNPDVQHNITEALSEGARGIRDITRNEDFQKALGEAVAGGITPFTRALRDPQIGEDLEKAITGNSKKVLDGMEEVGKKAEQSAAKIGENVRKGFGDILGGFGSAIRKELLLKTGTAAIVYGVLGVAAVTGSYYGVRYLYNKAAFNLGMPKLIKPGNTSRGSFWQNLNFVSETQNETLDGIILPPSVEKRIQEISVSAKNIKKHGGFFQNTLLYGHPGTGKTMFARKLAKCLGMDYAIVSGADFKQFSAKGNPVDELHKLFLWARKSPKGTILFIDEAEVMLRKRYTGDMSEIAHDLITTFLEECGTESNNVMIVLATNYPEVMDSAVMSRIGTMVKFPLPGKDERKKIFKKYYAERILRNKKSGITVENECLSEGVFEKLAAESNGLSGRDISQVVLDSIARTYATKNALMTSAHVYSALKDMKLKSASNSRFDSTNKSISTTPATVAA